MAAVIAAAVLVTVLPYVYGWLTCPSDKVFLGLLGQFGNDQAFYLGWGPKQAEGGHLLFEDKYNGFVERRLVFNSLWLLMGWTARLTGLSVRAVFHLERILFSVLLLVEVYLTAARYLAPGWPRVVAVAAVAFGSGFGVFGIPVRDWAVARGAYRIPAGRWTPDLGVAESNVFVIMLGELVLPAATALFLLAIRSGFKALLGSSRTGGTAGALTLVLGTVYPYAVLSVWAILAGVAGLALGQGRPPGRTARAYAAIILVSAPIVLYDGWLVLTRAALTEGQALYASPSLAAYFLGFGTVSVLACVGAAHVLLRRRRRFYPLLVWVTVTFAVIYVPRRVIPFQMQLILGVQIPLTIIAVLGAGRLWRLWAPRPLVLAWLTLAVVAVASTATSLYHYRCVFVALQRRQPPEYLDRRVAAGLAWLGRNAREEDVVLSTLWLAPYVPVLASSRVYCGDYEAPTSDFEHKRSEVQWVLNEALPASRPDLVPFLRERRIRWVVVAPSVASSPAEASARPRPPSGLEPAFANAGVRIFRVR